MGQLHIRDATAADATAIARVRRQAWLESYPSEQHGISRQFIQQRIDQKTEPEWVADWQEIINRPSTHVWVVIRSHRVVGFCDARKGGDHHEIDAIYLLKPEQGKGAGSKLMQRALKWLGNDKNVQVEVIAYNDRAIKFYQQLGFQISSPVQDHENLPTIFMTRKPH